MDLTLDPVTVDTKLAESYLKTCNNFSAWPSPNKFWHVKKYPDDKEEYDISELREFKEKQKNGKIITPKPNTIKKLVEKLKENESLFCQLEFVGRNINESDVKSNLVLICQHLQCDKDSWNTDVGRALYVVFKESTPLLVLGSVAIMSLRDKFIIVSGQKTAPICHLFTDLCAQVGWEIPLIFTSDTEEIDKYDFNCSIEYPCTGVVTESADIDSALDVFINSSIKAPWKLDGILVQESVYAEVRGALAARCGRQGGGEGNVLAAGGKVFAVDALGVGVPLEAYRTTRELCSLLQQRATPALSLWAADSQHAHEVALAAPASTVWINDYASFYGPPASALPLYEHLCSSIILYDLNEDKVEALRKRWIAWNKLSKTERVNSIIEQLEAISEECEGSRLEELQSFVMNVPSNSFVSVDFGKICLGVEKPVVFEDIVDYFDTDEASIKNSLIAAVNGAVLLCLSKIRPRILDALEKAGVAVMGKYDYYQSKPCVQLKQNYMRKKLKVIRSNFGTIFAN